MPTSLLEVTVHPDWQAVEQRARARDARLRIALQFIVIGVGLTSALLIGLGWHAGAGRLVATLLFSLTFLCFALWAGQWRLSRVTPRLWLALAAITLTSLIALLSTPRELRSSAAWSVLPQWPPVLVILSPLVTVGSLYLLIRRQPGIAAGFGLSRVGAPHQVAIGLASGLALGLHLTLAISAVPLLPSLPRLALPVLAWNALARLGVSTMAEELTFRGLLFGLLKRGRPARHGLTIVYVAALNLLLYAVGALSATGTSGVIDPVLWLLVFIYQGAFVVMATGLRGYHGSLWPSLAMNVAFSLFTAGLAL